MFSQCKFLVLKLIGVINVGLHGLENIKFYI